jgi:LacI family transcriptional regulator
MKNTTIKDVAAKAGISTATVSRYLNNKGYVSKEVQAKISQTIKELDFVPNKVAINLKKNQTKTIGIVIPDLNNVSLMDTVRALSDAALENGYQPIILCNDEDAEKENKILDVLVAERVNGIVIASAADDGKKILQINHNRLPVVLFDRDVCNSGNDIVIDAVINDNFNGSYKLTNYLISLGHQKIAILSNNKSHIKERLNGYLKALKDNEIAVNPHYILIGGNDFQSGYEQTKQLIMQPMKPTAIFAVNNTIALGAISALNEMNLAIPDKMSICAFGEYKYHTILNPDLTIAHQHSYEIGQKTAEIFFEKIRNYHNWQPQKIVLEADIVLRNSCSKP